MSTIAPGFERVFRLEVRHDYFDHASPPIAAEIDMGAIRWIRSAGGVARSGPGSLEISAPPGALAAAAPPPIRVRMRAQDPRLAMVTTAAPGPSAPGVAVADVAIGAALDIGPENVAPLVAGGTLTTEDVLNPPLAILNVLPGPGASDRAIHVRFGAASYPWEYRILGAADVDGLSVRDPDGAVAFDDLGVRGLPDGRATRVFRSATSIPCRSRPPQRFQLLAGAGMLIARLPAPALASAGVQEIYVTL